MFIIIANLFHIVQTLEKEACEALKITQKQLLETETKFYETVIVVVIVYLGHNLSLVILLLLFW